jgi:single-strand DNA-binding protein
MHVVGRLKQDRWTDPDGKPHSRIFIAAEHLEFKPQLKKQDGDGGQEGDERAEEAPSFWMLMRGLFARRGRTPFLPSTAP